VQKGTLVKGTLVTKRQARNGTGREQEEKKYHDKMKGLKRAQ